MAKQNIRPVADALYERRSREYPTLQFPVTEGVGRSQFFAPTKGFIEKRTPHGDGFVFRHSDEPYYSIFYSDKGKSGMIVDSQVAIGDVVPSGKVLGEFSGNLVWQIGAIGNTKDWIDPEAWVTGDYQVWPAPGSSRIPKKKTDWGTIAMVVGVGYVLLKGSKK